MFTAKQAVIAGLLPTKPPPAFTMNSIGARIRQMLTERHLSQAELARRCGMKQQTLSYLCSTENPSGSSRFALKISQELGVNPAWLQMGLGEPHDPTVKITGGLDASITAVPYLKCGEIADFLAGEDIRPAASLLTSVECGPRSFAITVTDESMKPVFRLLDQAIIDPNVIPKPGDYVVASSGGELVLRKYRERGNWFELVAANDDYPLMSSKEGSIVLGTAVEWRSYRPRR